MTVAELKAQIMSNTLKPFYIFFGDEWEVQKIYIQQIASVTGKQTRRIDSIADVYGTLRNRSFIKQDYIYVARDDKEFMQTEKLQNDIEQVLGDNIFILLITALDKRTKFYKTYKDSIITFEALEPDVLKKYIQKQIPLNAKYCDKLIEVCGADYGRILQEINKMKHFLTGQEEIMDYDSVFMCLLKDGTIHTPPKDAIFEFVDAILDNSLKCFNLYQQCLAVNEAVMVMLKVLYDNAKAVLQVQACESNDVSKATGLNGWQIKNATKHKGVYRNSELLHMMELCATCQRGIVTGTMSEEFVMPYIMCEVMM